MKKQFLFSLLILTGFISAAEQTAADPIGAILAFLDRTEKPPPSMPLNHNIQEAVQGPLTPAFAAAVQQQTVAEKNYKCPTCNKTFKSKNGLNLHKKTHNEDEWLSCKYCTKSFHRIDRLIEHTRKHTGEKPFVCKDCNITFSNKASLKRHTQRMQHPN
jgi:transposase-like protein